jgi:hypothetical protein
MPDQFFKQMKQHFNDSESMILKFEWKNIRPVLCFFVWL